MNAVVMKYSQSWMRFRRKTRHNNIASATALMNPRECLFVPSATSASVEYCASQIQGSKLRVLSLLLLAISIPNAYCFAVLTTITVYYTHFARVLKCADVLVQLVLNAGWEVHILYLRTWEHNRPLCAKYEAQKWLKLSILWSRVAQAVSTVAACTCAVNQWGCVVALTGAESDSDSADSLQH